MGSKPIVYASPFVFSLNAVLARAETILTIAFLVFVLAWGGNTLLIAAACGVAILVQIRAVESIRPRLRCRIELFDDHFWIGGLDAGRIVKYDDVSLIQSFPSLSYSDLTIDDRVGGRAILPLRKREAEDCLVHLHRLCGFAASVDSTGNAWLADVSSDDESRATLAATFLERAKHARWACTLGVVIWIATLAVVAFPVPLLADHMEDVGFFDGPAPAYCLWLRFLAPVASEGECPPVRRH